MCRVLSLIACLFIVASSGCGSNADAPDSAASTNVPLEAPWEDTEAIGSITSELGPTLKISSTKGTLFSILETVANHFSATISVEPSFLLDRPITVELEGDSAEVVLNALAKASRLELSKTADGQWQLVYPTLRDGKNETVKPSEY